jgi:Kef-type K+ transport system membrane component KefB
VEPSTDSFVLIAGLLLLAKLAGGFSSRVGMPSVLGVIVAGVVAGPAVLGVVGRDPFVENLGQVGVVLLMFLAGLETDAQGLRSAGKTATVVAIGGVVLPLGAGYAIGVAAGLANMHALFLGAILTATSVSITAETLKEMGRARSREGSIILGAAIIDDVLGVLVLSALVVAQSGGSIVVPILKLALFAGAAFAFARWVMPLVVQHHERIESPDTRVALALAMALGFAWVASRVGGLADVTGAFLAGVLLARTDLGHHITEPVSRLGYGLFIPIFFVFIGTHVTAHDLTAAPWLCAGVVVIAILTKLGGCGAAAIACRESMTTSLRVGAGMVGRGEIALVVASIGLAHGVVDASVFSIAIVVTVATTVAAPLLLKAAYYLTPPRALAAVEVTPRLADLAVDG